MNITSNNVGEILAMFSENCIDNDIYLTNSLIDSDVRKILDHVVSYEKSNESKCIRIRCVGFSTSQIVNVYRWFFQNPQRDDIRNVSLILNVLSIMKTYNTFDNSFFQCDDIFVNSIEQILDVKSEILDDIQHFCKDIGECYMSMLRSISKYEYSELDQYVDIPVLFKVIFDYVDILTLSGFLTNIEDTCQMTFKKYKFADKYVKQICRSCIIADTMISNFMSRK